MATCGQNRTILSTIFVITAVILIISAVILIHDWFRKIWSSSSKGLPKKIIVVGFTFYLISLIAMGMHIGTVHSICKYGYINTWEYIFNLFYTLQIALLLFIWFIRLYYGFHGTILAISKCFAITYISIFVIFFILAIIFAFPSVWINSFGDIFWSFIVLILSTIYVLLILLLSALFIYKLIKVFTTLTNDTECIDMITKITILNFTSLFITLGAAITIIFFYDSIYAEFVNHFAGMIDIYTNFLCVLISYDGYNIYYLKYCGCIHSKCNSCWFKIANNTDGNELASVTDPSQTTNTLTTTATSISA